MSSGTPIQKKVCNEAIKNNLVKPYDVIEYTFSNARLKEIKKGYIKIQNKQYPGCMSTIVTKVDKLGVVVDG